MKPIYLNLLAVVAGALLAGCGPNDRTVNAQSPSSRPSAPAIVKPASQQVVEDYLKAAASADGARMYALIGAGNRKDETPESLRKTAADRYSSSMTYEVLKTEETDNSSEVVVEFKGAKVDPNPTKFTLTRENGEWRIIDSPELHEREKHGGIHIKL